MYEGDYWISVCKYDADFDAYYVTIDEIYPSHYKVRNDIHNYEVLKRISECHRGGMDGARGFVKECIPFHMRRHWNTLCVMERLGVR